MPKIIQNQSKCIGCLACVGLTPEFFAADPETGLAKLQDAKQEGTVLTREVEQADPMLESACCGGAIHVEQ